MIYLISYDLKQPGQKYEKLHEQIKSLGSWAHILESTWLVNCNLSTADAVLKKIKPPIDDNDFVFIIQLNSSNYAGWLPKECWDWINKNL